MPVTTVAKEKTNGLQEQVTALKNYIQTETVPILTASVAKVKKKVFDLAEKIAKMENLVSESFIKKL